LSLFRYVGSDVKDDIEGVLGLISCRWNQHALDDDVVRLIVRLRSGAGIARFRGLLSPSPVAIRSFRVVLGWLRASSVERSVRSKSSVSAVESEFALQVPSKCQLQLRHQSRQGHCV
jgi:hypothetical protein